MGGHPCIGEEYRLFGTLTAFCTANNVCQGYISMFIAGFVTAEIVGTCEKLAAPV